MPRDYFAVLGLTPGRHDPDQVTTRFLVERDRLLARLLDADAHADTRRQLEELHLAYAMLRDPGRQEGYLHAHGHEEVDRLGSLRRLIAASLEDGLLRHSRRQDILALARDLGFDEFQTQLVIAQVQYGDDELSVLPRPRPAVSGARSPRAWARPAAVGVLALAIFVYLVRALGG